MRLHRSIAALLALALTGASARSAVQNPGDRIKALDAEARAAESQGQLEVAIQKYQEIVNLYPRLPAAYNNLGRLFYQQGRFHNAIEPLKRAAELDPNLEAPHAQLGFCFFQLGDFASSRREFESALKLSPNDAVAKLFLARSLLELRDLKGAVKLLDQLREADPTNVEVLFSLGWAYADLSVSTLGAIQQVDPGSYLIDVLQGKYAEVKQAYPEAAEHYKSALAKSPNQPDLCYDYAHALWASGDFPAALQQYRHVLELNPGDYRASWEAARIALFDNPQEALRLATQSLEVKPDTAEALTIRGRALLALGKPSEAIRDLKKSSELDQNSAANYFQLARAYRQLGRTEEANAATADYERVQRKTHATPAEDVQASPH
jgi:tetratricopeptide (TPR) repeat protein